MNRQRIISIVSAVLFILAWILVALSPFGEKLVASINCGYGTFDLKVYGAEAFCNVMKASSDLSAYRKYYACDFIFATAYFNFMIQMTRGFSGERHKYLKLAAYILAALRTALDFAENTILLSMINKYPDINLSVIDFCNIITRIKFLFMGVWFALFLIMIAYSELRSKGILKH